MNYPVTMHNKKTRIILTPYIEPIRGFVTSCEDIFIPTKSVSKFAQTTLLKLLAFTLLVGISFSAFAQVGNTSSYFSDIESSHANTFIASSLNFTLTQTEENEGLIKNYSLENNGILNFQYMVHASSTGETLCDSFSVEAKRDGVSVYKDKLNAFSSGPFVHTDTEDWEFIFTHEKVSDTCTVEIEFIGWQENLLDFGGYSHSEKNNLSFNADIIPLSNETTMHKATLEPIFDIDLEKEDAMEDSKEILPQIDPKDEDEDAEEDEESDDDKEKDLEEDVEESPDSEKSPSEETDTEEPSAPAAILDSEETVNTKHVKPAETPSKDTEKEEPAQENTPEAEPVSEPEENSVKPQEASPVEEKTPEPEKAIPVEPEAPASPSPEPESEE